jgi:hypothetical protein
VVVAILVDATMTAMAICLMFGSGQIQHQDNLDKIIPRMSGLGRWLCVLLVFVGRDGSSSVGWLFWFGPSEEPVDQYAAIAVDDALLDQELETLKGRHGIFLENPKCFFAQFARCGVAVHIHQFGRKTPRIQGRLRAAIWT